MELGVEAEGRTPELPETESSSVQSLFWPNTERPSTQKVTTRAVGHFFVNNRTPELPKTERSSALELNLTINF